MIFQVSKNKLLDVFTDHIEMVNKPTHISGSLIDHVFIKKDLMEEFFTNATVENIYFSDHDAVRILIEKNAVGFYTIPSNQIWSGKKEKIIGVPGFH